LVQPLLPVLEAAGVSVTVHVLALAAVRLTRSKPRKALGRFAGRGRLADVDLGDFGPVLVPVFVTSSATGDAPGRARRAHVSPEYAKVVVRQAVPEREQRVWLWLSYQR